MSRIRNALRSLSDVGDAVDNGYSAASYGAFGSWGPGMVWQPDTAGLSAMRISAVWACIRLLTDAISTLPADTYTREDGERRLWRPRPAWADFNGPWTTRARYLTQTVMSLLTDGNAFAAVIRDRLGNPVELVVLDPTKVTIRRGQSGIEYLVASSPTPLGPLDIVHTAGLIAPGELRGRSPIGAARDVIESAGEAQTFGRSWFRNSSVPPAVIKVPPSAGDAANQGEADAARARRIAKTWNDTHGGTSNAGKVGVLIGGAELQTVAIANKDSQWLESRQFSVQEIARIFGVPPHLIADSSNSTSWGSGLAEQNLAFGQFSLRPWIERIEDAHNRLLALDGLPNVFWKLNLDALLRASLSDRYQSYAVGIASGFLTPNEARSLEDLPPLPADLAPASMSPRELAEALQKIYLAVDVVISADEARDILNRAGANLTGAAPPPGGAP